MKIPLKLFGTLSLALVASCAVNNPRPPKPEGHTVSYELTYDDHGNPLGCSWYCGAPPITISATSTLTDGIYSYDPSNVHDFKKDTVWVEGAPGYGVGERLTFYFDQRDKEPDPTLPFGISSVSIINGFARSSELWKSNGRIKTFKVSSNGKEIGQIELEDTIESKTYALPEIELSARKIHELTFEIAEVYPGEEFEDTAVSDFSFEGFGVH